VGISIVADRTESAFRSGVVLAWDPGLHHPLVGSQTQHQLWGHDSRGRWHLPVSGALPGVAGGQRVGVNETCCCVRATDHGWELGSCDRHAAVSTEDKPALPPWA